MSANFSMTEQPYLRRPLKPGFGQVDITPSLNYKSITGKFISSDVIFIDIGCNQHLSHPTDHGGRPGDIVNRPLQIIQILGQHFSVDPRGLAVPRFLRARRVGHCGNKRELWVCLLQILQDFQEGRVLGAADWNKRSTTCGARGRGRPAVRCWKTV